MGSHRVGHNWSNLAAAAAGGQVEWCGKWKCIHAHGLIHPVSLCLLVGAVNPFTFKVIIDMYNLITVFLIVLGLFSVGRAFLFSCFRPREVPLAYVVKLVWWCRILFNFLLSGKLLISPSNLNESFPEVRYFWLQFLLFHHFKSIMPLPSGL